jgi:hypothetical protein
MSETPKRFVADTDARFVTLHPELRQRLREVEEALTVEMRERLESTFSDAPDCLRELLAPMFEKFAGGLPAGVIRIQYEVYKMVSDAWELSQHLLRERLQGSGGSPDKQIH